MTDLKTAQDALKYYMPEMLPTYERLCKLTNADKLAARFLTGYQPPAFISGCSQAVLTEGVVQLVRNYDYHPNLIEGAQLLTAWNGKKVIGTSDCLSGLLDGMNEDGSWLFPSLWGAQRSRSRLWHPVHFAICFGVLQQCGRSR
ncbi:MAG: carcinine hydrolase/isopenicillin-N N-acyltransferase family protein [Saprospiraceae bacterium]